MNDGVLRFVVRACLFAALLPGPDSAWVQGQPAAAAQTPGQKGIRTIRLETAEVTQPGLAVTPDGRSVIFSLLGHLFQVPAEGGDAIQLTFVFSYDSEPAVSPDGDRVAFVSDRDGSGGNIFVLDRASRKAVQLSRELQAGSPRWSPDGKTVAYFRRLMREEYPGMIGFGSAPLLEVRTVPSTGGAVAVVAGPSAFGALFYTPDGRLGWAIPEPGAGSDFPGAPRKMRLEAKSFDGKVALLGSINDSLGEAVLSSGGEGLYYSTQKSLRYCAFGTAKPEDRVPLVDGAAVLALTRDGSMLFYADGGKLWRVNARGGSPQSVKFKASVTVEARTRREPKWMPPGPGAAAPRAILSPQLSPDRKRLVFMAAGFLYEQMLDGGSAHRLFEGNAFERDPAFSPDGAKLAYAAGLNGRRELRVYDFSTKRTRTLYSVGGASWPSQPSWSPDGTYIVFQRSDALSEPYKLIRIRLNDDTSEELAQARGSWTSRPHFSPDGRALFFTERADKYAALYRLPLQPHAKPEARTALKQHVNDGLVSPDGKWLAFRRNTELWIAPLGADSVRDTQLRQVAADCSRSFAFTGDSSAIVYSAGRRVWRQPVGGGNRAEIPIRLTLQRATPAPLMVRHVRVVDLDGGRVGEDASILIEAGKISWIGAEGGRSVPKDTAVLDGGGRIAIPGLFDVHVHSAWANQMADADSFIAFGNTSVRDVGASLDLLSALRDRSETTSLPVPRYWYSGEILEGAMPLWGDAFMQIANEAEARRTMRQMKEWGADFVKVYLTVPWHLQSIMAEEAQRLEMPLVGHAISFEEMVRHALQGYASVEHTPAAMYDDGRKLMAASGTRWVGTLTCEGGSEIFMREDPPVHMAANLVSEFVPSDKMKAALRDGRLSNYPKEFWFQNMKNSLARIHAAYRDGVQVRAGTDALMAEVFFGLSLHWELEFFNMAGLTPREALRLGTVDAAETVGAAPYLGRLAPGALADIVLLDANPLENIRNTTKIWRVIKGGQAFDPETIRSPLPPR
jgi:Tol biopolymer transport system component/imidazolonepropionase-like amidohydrolase